MTRRRALGVLGAAAAGAAGLLGLRELTRTGPDPVVVEGTTRTVDRFADHASGEGEWWVPPGATGALPTVVLVHGGYWRAGYDRTLEDALAADLAGRGFLVWNLDYRPSTTAFPTTLTDAAQAYDHLVTGAHAHRVDRSRVAVAGHSAGGHLALWLASRTRLPEGHPLRTPAVVPALCVAQAPVADLVEAHRLGLGGGAVAALLDGSPRDNPERYAEADPAQLAPSGVRTVLVHGVDDGIVPLSQSEAYLRRDPEARLVRVAGGHFEHLDPATEAIAALREALATL